MIIFRKVVTVLCVGLVFTWNIHHTDGILSNYVNPYFHFPYGAPYMGILTAFAVPLKVQTPGDIFLSVNFEAAYSLPTNQTEFTFPPVIAASARQLLYEIFERKLESHGYPGRPCLLRAICEGAELSTAGTGVLGDIVHLILTPSSTLNANLTATYQEAEGQATKKGKCKKFRKVCNFSILKLFTWVGDVLNKYGFSIKDILKLK
ncbi:unnamed protein product [Ceutorhynchus assimilis]|uniref:Uncharacterized protein n=1 Tax=Ceutorhynchus assimilis TaxID=467358 RepID=A0A9N9QGY6_9CUCU|nr:unnamed protein product [Ceutorhynchus assimilis]